MISRLSLLHTRVRLLRCKRLVVFVGSRLTFLLAVQAGNRARERERERDLARQHEQLLRRKQDVFSSVLMYKLVYQL